MTNMYIRTLLLAVLLVVGHSSGKDIRKDYWINSQQSIDKSPAGEPHESDVLNAEEVQAEILFEYMPFQIPFNLDTYQKVAALRILKSASKPVLRSKELRNIVSSLDDFVTSFRDDKETKAYLSYALNIAQKLYESKDSSALRELVHDLFVEFNNNGGAQSRGLTDDINRIWNNWSPLVNRYMVDPVQIYVIQPLRSYVADPISTFASRISRIMGVETNAIDYQEDNFRWDQRANSLISKASDYTGQLRTGVFAAARILELQEANDCGTFGPCGVSEIEAK